MYYTLKVSCSDKSGLIAAITNCVAENGGNIIFSSQHTARDIDMFFCRLVFEPAKERNFNEDIFRDAFDKVAKTYEMEWNLFSSEKRQKMAVLVSQTNHCLYEILLKHQDGQLKCEIPVIISNHSDLATVATDFHIPFYRVDTLKGKEACEADIFRILEDYQIDLVCMARYMQILSPNFTQRYENRIINIHHGFLPAFKGAKPYHQAWQKGVKLIGATAHFANEILDQGPIIYQDVLHIDDTRSIEEFVEMGKDIERQVLVEALRRYFEHRIFIHSGRTFVI